MNYKTFSLKDHEYYNYDFKNIDVDIIQKYDKGAEHFLISQGLSLIHI